MTTPEYQHADSDTEVGYGAVEGDVDESTPAQVQPDRPEHDANDPRADGSTEWGGTETESGRGRAGHS